MSVCVCVRVRARMHTCIKEGGRKLVVCECEDGKGQEGERQLCVCWQGGEGSGHLLCVKERNGKRELQG